MPPILSYALAGNWLRASVSDLDHIDALEDLMNSGGRGRVSRTDILAFQATGGEQVLISTEPEPFTVVMVAWPEQAPAGMPEDLVSVAHRCGYDVRRQTHGGAADRLAVLAYWITHPDTGRVLSWQVVIDAPVHEARDLYDAIAGELTWNDGTSEQG